MNSIKFPTKKKIYSTTRRIDYHNFIYHSLDSYLTTICNNLIRRNSLITFPKKRKRKLILFKRILRRVIFYRFSNIYKQIYNNRYQFKWALKKLFRKKLYIFRNKLYKKRFTYYNKKKISYFYYKNIYNLFFYWYIYIYDNLLSLYNKTFFNL